MRRRVGTGSRNPAEAWSGAAKVFTNVCTVFFGMVRAQRGGAEPSPPPYVYSILGRAPPLCTVSSGRASVYCLAAGRRGWCRAVPAGSACSSLVRRVLEAYNGCQNESAAHGRPHTRYTHAYILYPDSRNHRKKRPTTAPHTPREARFSQIPQIHSTRAPHTTPARAPRRTRRRSRGGPRPHSGHTCEIVASWGRPPPGPRREHSWVAGPGVRAGLPRSLVVGKLEYPLLMSLVRCRMSAWQGHEVLTLVCRLVRVVHDPDPHPGRRAPAGPARPWPAPPLRGATADRASHAHACPLLSLRLSGHYPFVSRFALQQPRSAPRGMDAGWGRARFRRSNRVEARSGSRASHSSNRPSCAP